MKNLANILKYVPEGTKLYSPIFGEVTFTRISSSNNILCRVMKSNGDITIAAFTCLGRFYCDFPNTECVLFPSKDQRNWDAFKIPVKRGDIMMYNDKSVVFMVDTMEGNYIRIIAHVNIYSDFRFKVSDISIHTDDCIPASEDMKKKFFDAMDKAGYTWDGETLKNKKYQFKPFEKVLVRNGEIAKWRCSLYSHFDQEGAYHHTTISGIYSMCIPFKGNEHLVGTADNP